MALRNSIAVIVAGLAGLLATAALAQTPEAVYQKLHGAVLAKNMKEILVYATSAQRAEVAADPAAEAKIGVMAAMLPKTYTVTGKTISTDGNSARLRTSGMHSLMGPPAPMYGTVELKKESGEWRVEKWGWSSDKPAGVPVAQAAQAQAAPAPAAEAKPKAKPKATPKAPKPEAAPAAEKSEAAPKPAAEKPPAASASPKPATCVIKAVMTDQELRDCGADPSRFKSLK